MGNKGEYVLGGVLLFIFCVILGYLFIWDGGSMRDDPEEPAPPPAPPSPPPAPPAPPAAPAGPRSTGFEGGTDTPFVEIPSVPATTAASCATDHVGTYFDPTGSQCVGCSAPNFIHEDLNATNLNCDGPGGSSIVGAFTTLDATDYGDVQLLGGPERMNVKCQLSKYYEETNGIGSCSDFPQGACNDEYCRGSGGEPVPGSTTRGSCTSPNVWVGKYYSGRGAESAGDCNECDLTTNTIEFEGGSRTSFFNDFQCEPCAPGDSRLHVDNVGECVMCPLDHVYSVGPPTTCTECTGGRKYMNAATTTCDDCPATKYLYPDRTDCVDKITIGLNGSCDNADTRDAVTCGPTMSCNHEGLCKMNIGEVCSENVDCIGEDATVGGRDCTTNWGPDTCVDPF